MEKNKKIALMNFKVNLDINNVPEKIIWNASDVKKNNNEAKALMVSIWDGNAKSSLNMDLWTKEMMAEEMNFFTFQIIDSLSRTYKKAVGNEEVAKEISDFAMHIGKTLHVLK
tara:strand:- start:177 stop:515 length:339 start_codon:yes stop_codon:yes gene_type:complete